MTNTEIADAFDLIGDILDFQAANPFRVRAYRNGARTIRDYHEPLAEPGRGRQGPAQADRKASAMIWRRKSLRSSRTGSLPMLEELKAQVPESVLALIRIPGVGPKKAALLHKELGIKTLADLKAACDALQVQKLKGFGEKTQKAILEGICFAETAGLRLLWAEADSMVAQLRRHFEKCKGIEQLEFAGSYRRGKETVGDLDILVVANDPTEAMDCARVSSSAWRQVIGRGADQDVDPHGQRLSNRSARRAGRIVRRGAAVFHRLEGAQRHPPRPGQGQGPEDQRMGRVSRQGRQGNAHRRRDRRRSLCHARAARVSAGDARRPAGIRVGRPRRAAGADHASKTSAAICTCTRPPPTAAASIEEMVAAAQARGLSYIAITDHSQRVSMAHGLDPDAGARPVEGDRPHPRRRCPKASRCSKASSATSSKKAAWTCPTMCWPRPIGSSPASTTARSSRASKSPTAFSARFENPHVSHHRPSDRPAAQPPRAYEVDLDAVMAAAKKNGKLLELNANPVRLDLNDVYCAAAKQHGIPIVINTDAHPPDGLAVMRYGILQARRAGLTKADVANTRTLAAA